MLLSAWYSDAFWLRLLTPVAWVYKKIVQWRKGYLLGRKRWKPSVPVIVVGNISVGGTGKSPLVISLANYLKSVGLKPGVVSRGYGGRADRYPAEVSTTSSAREVGDEPVMIFNRTCCAVVVDPDRVRAVQELIEDHECDVVISDDGLQHYALERKVEIAVVDGGRGFGNGLCFPAGPLREPVSRLREVDLVVINGEGTEFDELQETPCSEMKLQPTRLVNIATGREDTLENIEGRTVHAVVGIGHPSRFFETLKRLGCTVIPHEFPDHHDLRLSDIQFDDSLPVVMTEKDAVKLENISLACSYDQYWYLEVSAEIADEAYDLILRKAGLVTG